MFVEQNGARRRSIFSHQPPFFRHPEVFYLFWRQALSTGHRLAERVDPDRPYLIDP